MLVPLGGEVEVEYDEFVTGGAMPEPGHQRLARVFEGLVGFAEPAQASLDQFDALGIEQESVADVPARLAPVRVRHRRDVGPLVPGPAFALDGPGEFAVVPGGVDGVGDLGTVVVLDLLQRDDVGIVRAVNDVVCEGPVASVADVVVDIPTGIVHEGGAFDMRIQVEAIEGEDGQVLGIRSEAGGCELVFAVFELEPEAARHRHADLERLGAVVQGSHDRCKEPRADVQARRAGIVDDAEAGEPAVRVAGIDEYARARRALELEAGGSST